MRFIIIITSQSFFLMFFIVSCQTQSTSPFDKAKKPYAHLGVEGYVGAAMTSCLGMAPQGPPITRKKDGATVIADDINPEQSNYFDCVDKEIYKVEERQYPEEID